MRPRDVLAAAHHGALVIGPVGAELVLVIAGCVEHRRGRRDGPSGRGAHHGDSRSNGPGGAVESSRDRRHAPLMRTACRSRTASTAIRPSVVYRTFARVQLGQRRRTLAQALADETRRLGRDNEPLRSSVDRLVIALRSAPSPAPSASPTAWPPADTDSLDCSSPTGITHSPSLSVSSARHVRTRGNASSATTSSSPRSTWRRCARREREHALHQVGMAPRGRRRSHPSRGSARSAAARQPAPRSLSGPRSPHQRRRRAQLVCEQAHRRVNRHRRRVKRHGRRRH